MTRLVERVATPTLRAQELLRRVTSAGEERWMPGASLKVGEQQAAVFVYRGKICDLLYTGEHRISALTAPQLSAMSGSGSRGYSPFSADLFCVSLREIRALRWCSARPLQQQETHDGADERQLHAQGNLALAVADPAAFLQARMPVSGCLIVDDIMDEVDAILSEGLATLIADAALPGELDERGLAMLNRRFGQSGLRLVALTELELMPAAG